MYKPGSIRKIEVSNFVTYSHVEIFPGPHLNMIIGPNGTGKSTMVAAIILGLGGNPKVVGRGAKISEYVKHNCDKSVINIFLEGERENSYIKVTRQFDTQDRSWWRLNNKNVNQNEVLNYIKKFNIQVNNLCQFLPQDRVQDFAKLNKQDLLKETQKALCRFDLIEKQETLVNCRVEHKKLVESIEEYQKNLQMAQDANLRLEGRVRNFNKKKEYKEKILHINRKIAWIMYEDIKIQLTEIKKDKKMAQEVYDKFKNAMKPMLKEVDVIKMKIVDLQQNNSKTTQLIRNSESCVNSNIEKMGNMENVIKNIKEDMKSKLAAIEQWDKEIESSFNKLEEMKSLQKEIHIKCAASNQERQTLSAEINKLMTHQKNLQDRKEQFNHVKQDKLIQIRALENEMNRLENVKHSRFQYLEKLNQDAFKATNWLRNNRHLFADNIYEPIMLEVNIINNEHAKYVENVIPMRDRLAFTCVNKNDMNKLVTILREHQHISVNVVYSENTGEMKSQYQPNIPIERLRKFGFFTYVNNLFDAPMPIMSYLCKTYHLHNIPVGDIKTNSCYEQVPKDIRQFFSDKYRYIISFSKYSFHKSTKQIEVFSDGGLSLSLDVLQLENLKGQIVDTKRIIGEYDNQIATFEGQLNDINEKIIILHDKVKEIQKEKQRAEAIDSRLKTTENHIGNMQQNKEKPDKIKKQADLQIKAQVANIYALEGVLKNEMKNFSHLVKQSSVTTLKIENFRKNVVYLDNLLTDNRRQCQEAEETFNITNDRYTEIMNRAKQLLNKAKDISEGFTPVDDGFDKFRKEYDCLAVSIEELNSEREQLQSRIACLNTADNGEMKEYEDRLVEIQNITEQIEKFSSELDRITSRMNRMQLEWLTPLKELISEINLKFGCAFERMGCAGEISVSTGDNDKDFSQYGISIKVTYRNGEPLQELNSNIQSGGERAVATAGYMLSLQELTPVPFRCVDEINQGMDVTNERRIFDLIVECTCKQTSAQYFLITPKLVSHLNYAQNIVVHIVHNGPFVAQDKKWSFSKLCNPHSMQVA